MKSTNQIYLINASFHLDICTHIYVGSDLLSLTVGVKFRLCVFLLFLPQPKSVTASVCSEGIKVQLLDYYDSRHAPVLVAHAHFHK